MRMCEAWLWRKQALRSQHGSQLAPGLVCVWVLACGDGAVFSAAPV
jgi:hypothetical protein